MLLTLSMTACNKKKEKKEDKPVIKQEEKVKISERKQKIINLVKAEMISENHIITENISTLDILKVYVYGYDKKTGLIKLSGIDKTTNINIDDSVLTSGLGELFPGGIYVGTVEKVLSDKYNLSKTVLIKTNQNFNDIHYVTILGEKK